MEKVLYRILKIILKNTRKSETSQPSSSKHTYRPMRARVVAQIFHKMLYRYWCGQRYIVTAIPIHCTMIVSRGELIMIAPHAALSYPAYGDNREL